MELTFRTSRESIAPPPFVVVDDGESECFELGCQVIGLSGIVEPLLAAVAWLLIAEQPGDGRAVHLAGPGDVGPEEARRVTLPGAMKSISAMASRMLRRARRCLSFGSTRVPPVHPSLSTGRQ